MNKESFLNKVNDNFHTIKSILNQLSFHTLIFDKHNFHTIKSILNDLGYDVRNYGLVNFHTIKSILNPNAAAASSLFLK